MKRAQVISLLFIAFFCLSSLKAQVTKADYERVDTLLKRNEKAYSTAVRPQWIGDTPSFWYLNHEKEGDIYYMVDAEKGKKEKAFDQQKLAQLLSKEAGLPIEAGKLPLRDVKFESKEKLSFTLNGKSWDYAIRQNKLTENKDTEPTLPRRWRRSHRDTTKVASPDQAWEAYIKDNNIYIRAVGQKDEIRITSDGAPHFYYSSQISWSPDSKKLATVKVRDVEERRIPLIQSSPESQLQPILQWRDYAKPGDVLPVAYPVLVDVKERKLIPLQTEMYASQYALYVTGWRKDSRAFTFEYNQRGHQRYIIGEVDAATGDIRHVVDEQSNTFIYYNALYRHFLNDGEETLWISERDGWRHIYVLDGRTGAVKRQVTRGQWVVRDVIHVDEAGQQIYFTASGFNPDEDPYNVHYCRIALDGSGFTDLTPENANHQVTFSKDYRYYVDAWSRPDLPPVSQLKKTADGSVTLELERCDITELVADGWTMPEVFHAKGRDGKTDIWGNIIRPSHFDPNKTYPVIEMIYAGPHDSHVDKSFRPTYHLISKLADLGFIVVSIDGMGTANRSKAFHDVCWKNLKDAGFPDRILWMKAAAAKYNYMDISNVGIYGWSAGGQNAMAALLFHNDFYKVAVAFCGCHDNRMDKIWWNEQWMGYPLDEAYVRSSNMENAHLLKGKLFLVNGELDDNVDPTSTLQVVNALVKANKNFDQLYLPARGHALGGAYELHRLHDFFVRHIKKQDPPEWE
ncbi:S9 family peptidase [Parabacteroides sp. PF5-6]|uniref:S9 family peptidase n=1 Tax=Parabacteroides sp. PF5-6 TaxID=1742403 RepID=UPI00240765D8|nr:S9 family peptidase [Parabacteroides sp. PF5-6]MDF9831321.1 dipeptidyl aminopeptidase/acylaminoacyl peptidase [Parabacteroides sp. PF5-6]